MVLLLGHSASPASSVSVTLSISNMSGRRVTLIQPGRLARVVPAQSSAVVDLSLTLLATDRNVLDVRTVGAVRSYRLVPQSLLPERLHLLVDEDEIEWRCPGDLEVFEDDVRPAEAHGSKR